MLEHRSLSRDLFALGLLGFTVFLGVSLFTYRPSDPIGAFVPPFHLLHQPDVLVYPQNETVANACGWWGAAAADVLFNALGLGTYYLWLSLAVVDVLLLCRRQVNAWSLRLAGWLVSLIGLTSGIALLAPGLSPGPVIGGGGHLGVLGRVILQSHFAFAGTLILAGSMTAGGLMLCCDYVLLRAVFTLIRAAGRFVRIGRRGPAKAAGEATERKSKLPQSVDEGDTTLSVRVRGKPLDEAPELADAGPVPNETAEETSEEEAPGADEAEPEPPEPVVKKRRPKSSSSLVARPHFPVRQAFDPREREAVMHKLEVASLESPGEYELPDIQLLIEGDEVCFEEQVKEVRRKAKILERTFADFGYTVRVVEIETGPVIAQYEVELEAGLRLSKITVLADDLAIALRVPSVRIVAPLPGKNTVGIEVPNEARQIVRLREVIEETNGKTRKMKVPLFLGKDVSGKPLTVDLSTLPHLLIAGRTGTGKSVCLNAIICSLLMTRRPDEVRLLLIDPKMVELSGYSRLPHLMHPVVTDMRKAEAILAWAVEKMEERYSLLARAGVRHITSYNQLGEEELMDRLQPETDEERESIPLNLPFIVIVADEIADLMMTAGKEVEQHIIRLAQKSRAVGIHLILATQKPTVDVITGLIKSNLPARIAFQVASRTDSRVVLDEMGAEKLLGNGDMLFLWPGTSTLLRGQGTYLTDDEINRIVDSVSTEEQNFVHELVNLKVEPREEGAIGQLKKRDDLYEAAVDIVVREGRGSVSLLQRSLGVGYGRAARLIDYMAEDSIVGPYAGSQAREVLISLADWERMQSGSEAPPRGPTTNATAALGTRRRPNRILPDGDSDEQEGEQPADAWSKRAVRPQDFDEPLDEAADEAEEDEEPTESDEAFLSDRTPEEEEVETDLLDAETYEDERNRYRAETA